jgi:hypothetical protein
VAPVGLTAPSARFRVGVFLAFGKRVYAQLERSWNVFRKAPPGRRFEAMHEARKEAGGKPRIVFAVIGALLLAGGAVLLFIPGPGLLLIAFGAALIARRSLRLARTLDRLELGLRSLARRARALWKRSSVPVRAGLLAVCTAGIGAAGYLGYLFLSNH